MLVSSPLGPFRRRQLKTFGQRSESRCTYRNLQQKLGFTGRADRITRRPFSSLDPVRVWARRKFLGAYATPADRMLVATLGIRVNTTPRQQVIVALMSAIAANGGP